MSVTLKGNASTATWGVPTDVYDGRVVSVRSTVSGEEVPLENSDGEIDGLAMLNKVEEIQCEIIYDSDFTPPSYGDKITVNSIEFIVTSIPKSWGNKEWRKSGFTAKKWDTLSA
jgi:hypothetical protein